MSPRKEVVLRPLPVLPDIARMVAEGKLTEADAQVLTRFRIAQAKKEARESIKREAELQEWRDRQEEEKEMAATWARFLLAHSPAAADTVSTGTVSIREAFTQVSEQTGCTLGCGHQPLTPEQEAAFVTYAVGEGFDEEEAAVVLEYAPHLVEFQHISPA